MSNFNELPDFAAFFRMYKQWESENQRSAGTQPQQPAGPQQPARPHHPAPQTQRPPSQRLSPTQHRPQTYRQTPSQNPPEFSVLLRYLNELKKRLDDIYAV